MFASLLFSVSAVMFCAAAIAIGRLPRRPRLLRAWTAALALAGAGLLAGTVLLTAGLNHRPAWNGWWAGLLVWAFAAFVAGTWQAFRRVGR